MKTILPLLTLTFLLTGCADAQSSLRPAEQALQGRNYGKAVVLLNKYTAKLNAERADYATYLKVLAYFHEGKDKAVVKTCAELEKNFPDSDWRRKGLFLKSRALVNQKKFKEAEEIYAAEANRLFSADRKQGLAQILIEFADELSRKPKENELDAPPPDFNKALQMYNKALALEIGRELKDEVQFKIAHCYQELSDWATAEKRYQAYLKDYDPQWSGPVGSPERFRGQVRESPLPAGKHWKQARFHLVEVQLAQCGQVVQIIPGMRHQALQVPGDPTPQISKLRMARQNAEDLLELIGKKEKALRSDTHWLLVRSYNLPHPRGNELDKGIHEARRFLKAHPRHPRATDTSRLIALTFQNAGQTENAIAAYEDFTSGANFTFVPEDGEIDPQIKTGVSCSETFKNWTQEAAFLIGQLRFQQKKYDDAIRQWREYIARYPNGAQWSQCQSGIINAEFQVGIDAVEDEDLEKARTHFDRFLQDHPLDGRARQILFTLGQMQYAHAVELEEQHESPDEETATRIEKLYRKAVEEWERLASKYPNTEESSMALYRIGVIQEEKLTELEQALATYQRLTWGSMAGSARQRFDALTAHSLRARTERTFRTNEDVYIEVTSRNAPKLTLNQYFLNLDAYFRKTHGIGGIDGLDVDLIEPDKTWEVEVPDYEKYKPTTQRIKIPFEKGKPGVCVIKVSEEDFEATTLVVRSDIDIITKTSRREVLVFAQDRVTNKPAAGVSVIASNGTEVFGEGKTGKDGVFRKEFFENLKDSGSVRIFASSKRGTASYNLDLSGLNFSTGLNARGYIYTEKSTYRPGETVNIRGILRDIEAGSYRVPQGRKFDVRVIDPKGRMLSQRTHDLSEFGAFDSSITTDELAPLGTYSIQVSEKDAKDAPVFNGSFEVQRYKLEKVKLAFDFEKKVLFRGEKVSASVKASYYWGTPAAGEQIDYTLPDGRTYSDRTDEEGAIHIEFDPSGFLPGRQLGFSAIAKQYNVTTSDYVFLAELGFRTEVKTSQEVALAGEPFDVTLHTSDADGEATSKKLILYVLRRETPKTNKILSAVPWISRPALTAAEVTVEEHTLRTDPESGTVTTQLNLEKGGTYVLRASGEDRFGQVVTAEGTIVVSDESDDVKFRFFAEATGKVGADLPIRLHSRLDDSLALITIEGEDIISHTVKTLKSGYNPVGFVPGHQHYPNFRISVAAMDDRTLRSAHKDMTIERELLVAVKPRKEVEAPGADGVIELEVTDQNGHPVEAALSVALVNEALYSLYPDRVPDIVDFFQSGAHRHAEFRLGSTCGFRYEGKTQPVVKSITEEKERLARKELEKTQLEKLKVQNRARYGARDISQIMDERFNEESGESDAPLNLRVVADPLVETPEASVGQVFGFAVGSRSDMVQGGAEEKPRPRREDMNASRWIAPVITDAKGRATVTIPLPESTTQWRLTARGCTRETLVAQSTASLITRKDFFLEIKTPVQAQELDSMHFLAKLHNLTDFQGKVDVTLQINDADAETITVDVRKNSVTDCQFEGGEIPLAESLKLTAAAKAGDASDTLVVDLPVRPWGMDYVVSAGGVSTGNAHGVLKLAEGMEYNWREMEITLSPSIQQALVELVLKGSHSSVQADDLLASVEALRYATARKGRPEDIRALSERVRGLVASLTSTQQDNGSWNWKGRSDLYATCRSYWALALASKAGFPLQPDLLQKTESYLVNAFSKLGTKDNETKSIVLHALSVTGKADFANLNRIYRERASLSANALARTSVALSNLKRTDFARDLAELLEKKVELNEPQSEPERAWWPGSGQSILQDRRETTAMALLALATVKPNSPLCQQAANALMNEQGCLRHHSPTSLGPVVAALAAFYREVKDTRADYALTVLVNDEEVETLTSKDIGNGRILTVPPELIKGGETIVRFEKKGPGTYHYSAVLTAFSPKPKNPNSWGHKLHFTSTGFYHDKLTYRGVSLNSGSTSPVTKVEVGQKIRVYSNVDNHYSDARHNYRVRKEFLPAGLLLVDGSLSGNFEHHEIGDGVITMYYRAGSSVGNISYELVAYAPGTYKVLPGIIRDVYQPSRMTIGKSRTITVLKNGETSDDPYKMNRNEHMELANLNFNDGNYDRALDHLLHLFKHHRSTYERDLARMLLWIYTMEEHFDAQQVVEMFEILRERHPDLTIPFDKILAVGKAYRIIGEFERAWLVFRATIDSSFINDASLSATLEDHGQFLGSLEYMDRIWHEYPDTSEVVSAYFAISQQLYEKAPKAHELKAEEDRRRRLRTDADEQPDYDRIGLLSRSLEYLDFFLTQYPEDPLVDDAAFSMANAFFAMKDYEMVVSVAERFHQRYPDSEFASSFQYMAALGHFWQLHYDQALATAAPVASGDSKDRDYARYITAQIHHAQGEPGQAIDWYGKVKDLYPDAREAIAYFEEEKISLDEVTTFKPGEKVDLDIRYRNIREAYLQIYKVDLMKLYLREKNLSNITKVHLAGIEPESELTLKLGDGKDYRDCEKKAVLPLKDEGAYLVICRGDNLFTSGMVLVTPLKLEIQETPAAGSLRVNVRDTIDEGYQANVHVKAIGSNDNEFKSGDTDLRGIFVAEGLNGQATVIARQDGRYAFYRGTTHLGQKVAQEAPPQDAQPRSQQLQQEDFLQNVIDVNGEVQKRNIKGWDSLRRGKGGQGVEVQKAY